MKRTILALLMIFMLLLSVCALGEEQPAETESDIPILLSLADYLSRYPDDEKTGEDGSVTEIYTGISPDTLREFLAFMPDDDENVPKEKKRPANTRAIVVYGEGSEQSSTSITGTLDFKSYGRFGNIKNARPVLSFIYYTDTEEMHITYPKGVCNDRTRQAKEQYLNMVSMTEAGNLREAVQAYRKIPDSSRYEPAVSYIAGHRDLASEIGKYRFEVRGEYVTFGRYEHEPIEWLVLEYDVENRQSLLISRYVLDILPYNTEYADVTWETCSLRTWLNGTFFHSAFDDREQAAVITAEVDNSVSAGSGDYDTDGGAVTTDRVFLLSYSEAWQEDYFAGDESRKCSPTALAASRGAWISQDEVATCAWWLRSPGSLQCCAMRVSADGTGLSAFVDYDDPGVRPVIRVNLDSDYFQSEN